MSELIDRQSALDALEEGFKDVTKGVDKLSPTYGLTKAVTGIYKCLVGKLPSAQPKRGKWIEYEQEFMLEESLKTVQKTVRECSVCTAKIAGMVGIMNYCPNCGAKMGVTE